MNSSIATGPLHDAVTRADWRLRLYVAGQSPKSLKAFANLERVCNEYLEFRYEIEVVDLVDNPHLAADDEIIAIPTLVRLTPAPTRKLIGDLSDTDRVLTGLQLQQSHAVTSIEYPPPDDGAS
jgi:circadian clock protein KaiB